MAKMLLFRVLSHVASVQSDLEIFKNSDVLPVFEWQIITGLVWIYSKCSKKNPVALSIALLETLVKDL